MGGPGHVQWNKQHPYAMTLESRETRASHQPGKGIMARNSPHWKKSQKAGLTREVTALPDQRATVPAESCPFGKRPPSLSGPRSSPPSFRCHHRRLSRQELSFPRLFPNRRVKPTTWHDGLTEP